MLTWQHLGIGEPEFKQTVTIKNEKAYFSWQMQQTMHVFSSSLNWSDFDWAPSLFKGEGKIVHLLSVDISCGDKTWGDKISMIAFLSRNRN